jgi:FkbM family methyltransferase
MSTTKKVIVAGIGVLVLAGATLAFSPAGHSIAKRGWFWVEQTWTEHWPLKRGKWAMRKVVPRLSSNGMLGPVRVEVEPRFSLLLDPLDLVSRTILNDGAWQPEVWDSISTALSNGGVFFDVGAHIGYFSLKAARTVGNTGRVVSFEPNPETLEVLRDNVKVNDARNVTVEPIACTDREQMLTLFAAPISNSGASSLARANAAISPEEAPRAYSVRGRRIDDVVRELNLSRLDAMKIDVEGAELQVLRGAFESLKRFHPKLVVEMVPAQLASFNSTVEDVASTIRAAGYTFSRPLTPRETDWEWAAEGPHYLASMIRTGDASTSSQLVRGFHAPEGGWRWTTGHFTVALRRPADAETKGARLVMNFSIPDSSLKQLKTMTLAAKVGGTELPPDTFTTAGNHEFRRDLPRSSMDKDIVYVDFSLDRYLAPSARDGRELGVVVTSLGLEPK